MVDPTNSIRVAASIAICLSLGLLCTSARAYTLKTLYSFCAQTNCADGQSPAASLLMDKDGRLYGTATAGGDTSHGTAFGLTPTPDKAKWKFHRLHSFCANDGCTDGADPEGSLIIDTFGNLYGTTYGKNLGTPKGTVFELISQGRHWKHKILRNFDNGRTGKAGQNPTGGLGYQGQISGQPYDGSSTLYGTNSWGGKCGEGTVYQLAKNLDGKWTHGKSYAFCGGNDGYNPWFGLLLDQSGDMYGTNFSGGSQGSVYKLRFDNNRWVETVLHVIGDPPGPLVMDSSGFLFGVSNDGGAHDGGFAFKLSTDGSQYAVLYDFCSMANCSDGQYPTGVIRDNSGNLYGVAYGGTSGSGVVFKLTFNGTSWDESILHTFCSLKNCRDGALPYGGLIIDATGDLYGTTLQGGRFNGGIVFELSP